MASDAFDPNRMHESALAHVSGRAEYIDDRPFLKNELFVGLVTSPHAHARIGGINTAAALKVPGVVCVLTARDLHQNHWGSIFSEQPFIADAEVRYAGEVVAVIGARTKSALSAAQKALRVSYVPLPAILSIDAAIAAQSFIGPGRSIQRGQSQGALQAAPHRLTGQLIIRGAEHFYLENQAAIAYPREDGQLEVHASTQHPTETQHLVAEALGLKQSDVVCICKRLGGGFGGKETQAAPFAVYAAAVARASGCPARLVLSKDEDMIITGKRNPFQIRYQAGFDKDGRMLALEAELFSDGGAYADLSTAIMERALLHCDNAYFIPHVTVKGQVCRTHFHPHTAFRGFGGPKGVALIESIMEEIAAALDLDALDVRRINCYSAGERAITPYGQTVDNNMLPRLFEQLEASADYRQRRHALALWNQDLNRHPRGMALTAIKFGISFTTRFLNQGNALLNIQRDGSVQVSTGAVEMGQGVHTRIAALVADSLGLPFESIRVMSTSTEKNANTSPTAASTGTDINGAAAIAACDRIKARLSSLFYQLLRRPPEHWAQKTAGLGTQPEIEVEEGGGGDKGLCIFSGGLVYPPDRRDQALPFTTLVAEAYFNRISLCDYGFTKFRHLGFNKLTGQGRAFLYYTQGGRLQRS